MDTVTECPKCGFTSELAFSDCPKCGIIVGKFLEKENAQGEAESIDSEDRNFTAGSLKEANALMIRQQKEWGEILTDFETRNKYDIMDLWGNPLFRAEEEGGSFFTVIIRTMLKALRPFTMDIYSTDGFGIFTLKRPFRFFFYELDVYNSDGSLLGKIKRRFSLMRRIYSVIDRNERELYTLFGPILHPWTFQIQKNGEELGKITKKWSGMLKESFTDADNFGINFPKGIDVNKKAILLGAVFLIDFAHFENRGNR